MFMILLIIKDMVRFGIYSKHIVLSEYMDTKPRHPQAGVILIEDGIIQDVILTGQNDTFGHMKELLHDWTLQDYTDLYISPGIIDINTRIECDSYEKLTQEAVKGGVTLVYIESGHHYSKPLITELYCDLAHVQIVDENTLFDQIGNNVCALKGYLFPPANNVKSIANLEYVINAAKSTGLPLMIDPTMPDPRMLYMASPLRLEKLEDRNKVDVISSGSTVFAAAFPESMDKLSSSEESEDCPTPISEDDEDDYYDDDEVPIKSNTMQGENIKNIIYHQRSISDEKTEKPNFIRFAPGIVITEEVEKKEKTPKLPVASNKSRRSSHDIYTDLDVRIKASQNNIEDLCLAEKFTYSFAGQTSFLNIEIPKKSSSMSSISFSEESPQLVYVPERSETEGSSPQRRRSLRPAPIQIKVDTKPDVTKDYTYYLANCPEHWEISGVEKVLELVGADSKIHFSNLSSAAAINRVRQFRSKCKNLSCEIAAVQLYFNSSLIRIADTRFKNSPPIRNRGNCNLLWDLLKMKGIDCICSQHISLEPANKLSGNFQQSLSGISSIGCTLSSIWHILNVPVNHHDQLEHYIVRLAKWLSLHPAKILGIDNKRGKIEKGRYADLVLWDPKIKFYLDTKYGYYTTCPFVSMELLGKIHKVFIRGQVAFDAGRPGEIRPVGLEVSR